MKKTALITGSEGQLGRVFVSKLLDLGYQVVGFDLKNKSQNSQSTYYKVDISKPHQIEMALAKIDNVDLLINNAGTFVFTPFEERTESELDSLIGSHLKGTIFMTKAVFNKFFKPKSSGCVVNIGSIYGVVAADMGIYNQGDRRAPEIYGAVKAAIINLTKYFSVYMAPYKVRVNCISPGGVFNHQNPEFIEKYSARVPMGRMIKDQELLSTLEYLTSDDSSYTTGQNITVDGGLTAW